MKAAGPVSRWEPLVWSLCIAVLICGWLAYGELPHRSEPQIPVREVRVITPHPGASAAEVEREVSDRIEQAVRGLDSFGSLESLSSRGLSVVSGQIQDRYDDQALPRIRDGLRHRIDDAQR